MRNVTKKIFLVAGNVIFFFAMIVASRYVRAENMIIVTSNIPNGWWFYQETPTGSGAFTYGPSVPPLGAGSAQLTVNSTGGVLLGVFAFAGTRLDAITSLAYSTYRSSGTSALAPSLQLDIDTNVTDANVAWQGRLVYEPYYTHAVSTGVWQIWNPLDNAGTGNWWFTGTPGNAVCTLNNPCTWSELRAAFPNAGIRSAGANTGATQFKAGGGWASGFVGSVDAFSIGVNNVVTTYDFESLDIISPADIIDLSVGSGTSSTIDIAWTASGNDGNTGTATTYDIRYSTSTITTENFNSATQVFGVPTPQIAGTSQSMTVSELFSDTIYYFAIKSSDQIPNPSGISNVASGTTSASLAPLSMPLPIILPPAIFGGGLMNDLANVSFYGQAYPGSVVKIFLKSDKAGIHENIQLVSTLVADDGRYKVVVENFLPASYFFAIQAIDRDGRESRVLPLISQVIVSGGVHTLKDILVPPTISAVPLTVSFGREVTILGYAAPSSVVELFIDNISHSSTVSDLFGFYKFTIDTAQFPLADHVAKTRFILPIGAKSDFSFEKIFWVSPMTSTRVDLDGSNTVTVGDWSIFLFRWGSADATLKLSLDFNDDGRVDVSDFSVLLHAIRLR